MGDKSSASAASAAPSLVSLKCEASKSVVDLLGMNLSPPFLPGEIPVPSLPGDLLPIREGDLPPSRDGDLLGVLDGVFLVRLSLSLLRPEEPTPFRPEILQQL